MREKSKGGEEEGRGGGPPCVGMGPPNG